MSIFSSATLDRTRWLLRSAHTQDNCDFGNAAEGGKNQRLIADQRFSAAADPLVAHALVEIFTTYIPHPKEWTHEFCWHGVDPLDKTHLIQGLNIFTQLRTIADQIYYNVSSFALILGLL